MSFNIGLSGMRAASKDLNVTGNNIANAGTVGFKQSRAEFADVYASSIGIASNAAGSGVRLSNISQQFTQGNISYTQNALDLAINGEGFFEISKNGAKSYTRTGYFGVDREGFLVDNFGNNLQGRIVENEQLGKVANLRIEKTNQQPRSTSTFEQTFNLNSTDVAPASKNFDPADPSSYNSSSSTNIYDSQGNAHVLTQYFVKTAPNQWQMNILIDGRNPADPAQTTPYEKSLVFKESGELDTDVTGLFTLTGWSPAAADPTAMSGWAKNGAAADPIQIDIRNATQYASSFGVNAVSQDGYTTGQLAGLEIDEAGKIFARYTNGQSKIQGQVVLASFANEQGLKLVGNNQWVESFESGEPVRNEPGSATLGLLEAGALEDSNVELADQLVNLIVAQRNYQANAKTIETESALTQTIINLR